MKAQQQSQIKTNEFRDRGLDCLGKVYDCEKIEAFDLKEYAHALAKKIAKDLECAEPDDDTIACRPTPNMSVYVYCNELITINISAFKAEKSLFIDFIVRKSQPRYKITAAFNYIADNYGGKGRNHILFYRP